MTHSRGCYNMSSSYESPGKIRRKIRDVIDDIKKDAEIQAMSEIRQENLNTDEKLVQPVKEEKLVDHGTFNNTANPKDSIGTHKDMLGLDPHKSKQGKIKLCSKALHPELAYPLVEVSELSLEKGYKPFNFLEEGKDSTRVLYWIEAAQRHIDKYKMGYTINNDEVMLDGSPTNIKPRHLAQAAYNLLCAILVQESHTGIDDRLFVEGKLK